MTDELAPIESIYPDAGKVGPEPIAAPERIIDASGRITLRWDHPDIRILIDNAGRDNRGLQAMIRVTNGDRLVLLPWTKVNLADSRARSGIRNSLNERFDLGTESWDQRIVHVTEITGAHVEEISEGVWLHEAPTPPPIRLLNTVLEKNKITMLQADGGTGKSRLALGMAIEIGGGPQIIPGIEAFESINVLFLDFEDVWETQKQRVNALLSGVGSNIWPRIRHERMGGDLPSQMDAVLRLITRHDIGLVIVDSVGESCGGKLTDDDIARAYIAAVKRIPCTTLLIAHPAKSGDADKPLGSNFWWSGPRSIYAMSADGDGGAPESTITLRHVKSNDRMKRSPTSWVVSSAPDNRTWYTGAEVTSTEKGAASLSQRQLIAVCISKGFGIPSHIAEEIHRMTGRQITDNAVRAILSRQSAPTATTPWFEKKGDEWVLCDPAWEMLDQLDAPRNMLRGVARNVATVERNTWEAPPKGGSSSQMLRATPPQHFAGQRKEEEGSFNGSLH